MKKIFIVRYKVGLGLGGAESHAAHVAIKLLERGFQVGVIAHEILFPEEVKNKISFYPIKFQGFGSVPKHLLFYLQAKKILSQIPKATIINFARIPIAAHLFIMCDPLIAFLIEQKQPFIAPFRFRYQTLLNLERKTLLKAKKIISLFSLGKSLIEKHYPSFFHKTFICYRGLDQAKFNPFNKNLKHLLREKWGFSKEDYLLLFVGLDTKRKGLKVLLKIMPFLPQRIKLVVAGVEGKNAERIIYLGKVSKIEELYALADLFVLPTLYDPGALATLEALASGTPVITTPYDGTKEFVKEGINGFIAEPDPESFRKSILKALEIPFNPIRIANSIKNLTWDQYVDCLLSHLEY
ncbi:MAG: glycosyltransferase family 4 protein [Caldimicrobium sp.]|nr:glycosyltransferase family 4 protein [Caldimicrobium sp.]MDW8094447.1 glycosyltransferase family 4 protein [Caldimicrobium sp.]